MSDFNALLSLATTQLEKLPANFRLFSHEHSRSLIVTAALAAISAPWVVQNYHDYIALGPGGMPHNAIGWFYNLLVKPFTVEQLSTAQYDKDEDKSTWLEDRLMLPTRVGIRPKTSWHVIPSRQLDQFPGVATQQSLQRQFDECAKQNAHLVEVTRSPHEKTHDGLVIHSSISTPHYPAEASLREIAHVHRGLDHSLHVVLSPQDCKLVIEHGWCQRHPLSGSISVPKEYLMVYAPRDEDEIAVAMRIVKASIGTTTTTINEFGSEYVTGSKTGDIKFEHDTLLSWSGSNLRVRDFSWTRFVQSSRGAK